MSSAPVITDPNAGGSTTVTASMPPGPPSGAAEVLGGIPAGQPDTQGLGQAPRAPDITPVPPHRSFVGKILGAVADILGGKGENEINPQTGQREFHPFSRGQQAGNILSNAVRGFAAGTQAHGPGAGLRSMGLGAGAVAEQNLQREQISHQQQMQEAELNQTKLLRNAQIALTNQEIARSVWEVEKESAGIDQQTAERINEMNAMVAQDSRNRDLGHYASFDEFISKYKTAEPDMLQKQAQGLIRAVPTFQNGKPTGVQLYEINPSWAEQRNDKPVPMPMPAGVDKNGQLTWKEVTIPAGGMTNGQIVQAGMNVGLKAMEVQANLAGKKIEAGGQITAAGIHAKGAETAALINQGEATPVQGPDGKVTLQVAPNAEFKPDAFGFQPTVPPGGAKAYNAQKNNFLKARPYQNLQTAIQTQRQFAGIIDQMEKGNYSGAASIVGLFDAIGISATPLKGGGFRMNQDVINEHIHARGLDQGTLAALLKLKKGDIITPQQLKDYAGIASGVVRDGTQQAVETAHALGLNADFLLPHPSAQGTQLDPIDANMFLGATSGNKDKARALAQSLGWSF